MAPVIPVCLRESLMPCSWSDHVSPVMMDELTKER
jgi:hypothetical protein